MVCVWMLACRIHLLPCPLLIYLLVFDLSVNTHGAEEDETDMQDEGGQQDDEENEDLGGLPSMQLYHQQQEMSMERRSLPLCVPCLLARRTASPPLDKTLVSAVCIACRCLERLPLPLSPVLYLF